MRNSRHASREVADAVLRSFREGGKLLIAGNGGSAADAQHLATEFLSRFVSDRRPLPAIALTTDTSALTAIGNDYGFEHVFERQVRALGTPRDVFLAISTSGPLAQCDRCAAGGARDRHDHRRASPAAIRPTWPGLCDFLLQAPSQETAIIQQIHIIVGHIVCGLVEHAIVAEQSGR